MESCELLNGLSIKVMEVTLAAQQKWVVGDRQGITYMRKRDGA